MRRLLLISSSKTHGAGYLDHCESQIKEFLDTKRTLFLPFAVKDLDGFFELARERLERLGAELSSLHRAGDPDAAIGGATAVFAGGGNTFRLLKQLYELDVLDRLRSRILDGMPYIGTSAGSNIACPSIGTTNDMPIVETPSLRALNLVPFYINPHFFDTNPEDIHQGETREQRIFEFHEENAKPVVALREGAMLLVRDGSVTLLGSVGGRLYRRGVAPLELEPGEQLDFLLD